MFRKKIESKSANFISQEKFGKKETSFLPSFYNKWSWLHYDEAEDSVYCIICKIGDHYKKLNDIRVENSSIKTGYSNWKHARSTGKGFHQHESLNCHQQAIQRLIEISKSTEDVSEIIKSNSTEVKSQNRACLIKIISCLRYLAHQGLPLRGHGNDQDSNFKQLLTCRAEDDPVFSEWLNRKNQNFT